MKRGKTNRRSHRRERQLVWALAVFGGALFPDARLRTRAVQIAERRLARPRDSIAQASADPALAKATYRFIENPRVHPHMLWTPLHEHTARRLASQKWVFAVADTTDLLYPTLEATTGLGTMNTAKQEALHMHSVLALRPDGGVLGLLHNHVWARPPHELGKSEGRKSRPIEQKESFKWIRGQQAAAELRDQFSPATELVFVADREGDVHEVFEDALARGDHLIIRNRHDRRVDGEHPTVGATLAARPVIATVEIEVPRCGKRRKRMAHLEMRAAHVTIAPPRNRPACGALSLNVVEVREAGPPCDVEPVHWVLWTTWAIDTVEECLAVVDAYRLRWRVEDFHRVLKDGCRIERVQFRTAERIEIHLAFCCGTAARLLEVTHWARTAPEAKCTEFLSEIEWRVLWVRTHERALEPRQPVPTVREVVRMLGRLGGHLARKCDGLPGIRSLWKGWAHLQVLVDYHCTLLDIGALPAP